MELNFSSFLNFLYPQCLHVCVCDVNGTKKTFWMRIGSDGNVAYYKILLTYFFIFIAIQVYSSSSPFSTQISLLFNGRPFPTSKLPIVLSFMYIYIFKNVNKATHIHIHNPQWRFNQLFCIVYMYMQHVASNNFFGPKGVNFFWIMHVEGETNNWN